MRSRALKWLVILSILLVACQLTLTVAAQKQPYYYITAQPTSPDSPLYTTVNRNWTISYNLFWSYGDLTGSIPNANVTIEISNQDVEVGQIVANSDSAGRVAFNYSSETPIILTFTPTKVITEDGKKWTPDSADSTNNIHGLLATPVTVWWDTFNVSLVSFSTNSLNEASVTVNVTYLLLPEEGLSLPGGASYSNQTYLSKAAQNAMVSINGVKAQEGKDAGIYTANLSIWLPTVYAHVDVSQDGWDTEVAAFSFSHTANQTIWGYILLFAAGVGTVFLLIYGFYFRKTDNPLMLKRQNYWFYGGVFLAITSIISLYWVLVSFDSFLHGFNWLFFGLLGVLSFAAGMAGTVMTLKGKHLAFTIFAVVLPSLSVLAIKNALEAYQLTTPWPVILVTLVLAIVSGILICNSDKHFQKQEDHDQYSDSPAKPK